MRNDHKKGKVMEPTWAKARDSQGRNTKAAFIPALKGGLFERRSTKGKLYGVGIGPGDPKLLTIRAKEVLGRVDVIFVPKANEDGLSFARSIIEGATLKPKKFIELTFPMTKDRSLLNSYWKKAARKVVSELAKDKNAAFVTIGDPFVYSTYIYLLETLQRDFPGIQVETIPGISAFNAASSRAQFPLVQGDEKMAVLPVTKNLKALRKILGEFDTVVLMKVGSKLKSVLRILKEMKLIKRAVLISHVGRSNEAIVRDLSSLKDKQMGYLSVIIVKSGKSKK